MKNKNIIIAVLVIAAIVIGAYLMKKQPSSQSPQTTTNQPTGSVTPTPTYNPQTQGKIVFGIADATADMAGVTSVQITVNKVELHSAASGWVTVSNETRQYDLLALKQSGKVTFLANVNAAAGVYDQARLMVSKVMVTTNSATTEAKLPSSELKINGNITVSAGMTSSIVFDFDAEKSLHVTGDGKFIFAPVLTVKNRNNVNVSITQNGEITQTGGNAGNESNVGMDEKGEVKSNFELKGKLELDANGVIKLGGTGSNVSDQSVFNFSAQSGSGLTGTATIKKEGSGVKVTLNLNGGVLGLLSPTEPAHIHTGTCANIGAVKYPLSSVVNGKSETSVAVSMAGLKAQAPLSINVHKSAAELGVYIACTDLNF